MMKRIHIYIILLTIFYSGCSLVPSYERPKVDMPGSWSSTANVKNDAHIFDWSRFGSKEASRLIALSFNQNQDVQAALSRIEQARATVKITRADLFPSLDLNASANSSRMRSGSSKAYSNTSAYSAGLDVAYEVDLFGRVRASTASANALFKASTFDYEAIKLIAATDTATAYFSLLATTERLHVAEKNLTAAKEVYGIIQSQFKEGRVSALELAEQKVLLSNSQAAIATLENQRNAFRYQLAVLTGHAPKGFSLKEEDFAMIHNPEITLTQPATLLDHRPDIQTNEAVLQSANIDIGKARSALFPNLSLAGSLFALANPVSSAADITAELIASLSAPIFHGGALEGEVEFSTARKEELVATYRQTVLTSFQEVENGLSALKTAKQRQENYTAAITAAQEAYTLARNRYKAGAIDFQTLLTTQQNMLQTEDSNVQARLDAILASISLVKAMGGLGNP